MKALLVLAGLLSGAYLVKVLIAEPDFGRDPRLAAVVDGGKMEEFIENISEKEAILRWVEDGAPERDWPRVLAIFRQRCNSCHHSEASFETIPLDRYETAARSAEVRPVLEEKITGGTMGEYLESAGAQQTLLSWIERGALESEWEEVKTVLDAHCVQCHNPEGVQGLVRLDVYRPAARLARMPEPLPQPIAAPMAVLLGSMLVLGLYGGRGKRPILGPHGRGTTGRNPERG